MTKPVYIYVTPFFPGPDTWRGAYCYDFVNALKSKGQFCVEVFKPGDGCDYEIDGINVHTFRTFDMPSNVFPFMTAGLNKRSFLCAVKEAGIEFGNIAVCHGNNIEYSIYPLAIKKRNRNCKMLLHHHSLGSFGFSAGRLRNNRLYRFFQTPILRFFHKQMDCHVFISEECRRHFEQESCLKLNDYRILHNGVDISVFKLGLQKCKDKFVIGTVANFQKAKGYETTISALARINKFLGDWEWRIVGSGGEEKRIKKAIIDAGIEKHVRFIKEVKHNELATYYQSLDLYVMPSYWEGFGCVYTEAYACGVPFIACKENNGIVDIAPEEWLISKNDDLHLSELILSARRGKLPLLPLKGEYRLSLLVEDFINKMEVI